MDVKFVILLVVALAIVFLLISEIYALKSDMDKKFNDIDSLIEKNNEDIKSVMKKEINTVSSRFKTYTNEMLQQIRTMNSIEKQQITLVSDQFVEVDSDDVDNNQTPGQIPYLSEMPPGCEYKVQVQKQNEQKTKETEPYMSNTELEKENNEFRVRELPVIPKSLGLCPEGNNELMPNQNTIKNSGNEEPLVSHDQDKEQECENSEDSDNDNGSNNSDDSDDSGSASDSGSGSASDSEDSNQGNQSKNKSKDESVIDEIENQPVNASVSPNHNLDEIGHSTSTKTDDLVTNVVNEPSESSEKTSKSDKSTEKNNEIKKKLQKYKKLQESMENDDISSQEITVGSNAKGGIITIKTNSLKNKNKTIVDDLSMGTTDDNSSVKMKPIARYTKIELEELAKKHGVVVPNKSNKTIIYNAIRQVFDNK